MTNSANQTWATLQATDDTLVELGDGSHTVEIDPDTILQVGETAKVFDLKVTLADIGFFSKEENTGPNHSRENWCVDFTVENTSSRILCGIHPVVNTQIQYILCLPCPVRTRTGRQGAGKQNPHPPTRR